MAATKQEATKSLQATLVEGRKLAKARTTAEQKPTATPPPTPHPTTA